MSFLEDLFGRGRFRSAPTPPFQASAPQGKSYTMAMLDGENAEITMYVNSNGGLVSEGLALYDVMQSVTAPVRTVCIGAAASMAALLFLSGTKGRREILPHSRIMIHDPLVSGGLSGSATAVNEKAKQLMETREATAKIIAAHTGHSMDEVYGKTATDSWFDAESAIRWGMADRIIRRI